MKRFLKILPILTVIILFGSGFLFSGAQASDCEHSWSEWSGRDGQHRRECQLCGSVVTGECEYYSIILRPTCTVGGHTEKTCTLCGDTIFTDETPAAGHTWDEGTQILAPTCVADGKLLYSCLACDVTGEEAIAATGEHTVVNDPAVESTCSATGLTEGAHCGVCGEVFIEQKLVTKKAHEWDLENITVVIAPTCQPGLEETGCKNCDAVGQRTLPATQEHIRFVQTIEKRATCTEDGCTQHVICSVCETVLFQGEVIPAAGHEWKENIHKQPTCTTDGLVDRYCEKCGSNDIGLVIPAMGHTVATNPAKAATCTQGGYTASVTCSVCLFVFAESVTTPALGHDYEEAGVREPTCTSDGRKTFECSRCTASYYDKIDRLGHDMYIFSTTDPTCTVRGLILQKCRRCSHTLSQSIPELGHEEQYNTVAPTCTEGGYTEITCSRCDYAGVINETQATGHSGEVYETVAPTCTEGGYEKLRCTACGFEYEDNAVSAKGHTYTPGLVVAPTCTEDGYTVYNCLYCDDSKTENPIAATGHSLYASESNGDGTHSGYCSKCAQAVKEPCSGGVLSCLQAAVCAHCGGNYGTVTGEHSFTKYTVVNDSYHRIDCANCQAQGETTEKHSFVRGEFVPVARGFLYTCRICAHQVWGRPIGDAEGNGTTGDAGDARAALRYSVGLDNPTDADKAAADADRDGEVTAADARLILRVSVGLEEKNWSVLFVNEDGSLPN
ncbi:MAG: hypothetical protein E7523_05760 [Ruminococcaceae bacterium]|nr:hypothetical protein [Oscillospiraceae bacterium]